MSIIVDLLVRFSRPSMALLRGLVSPQEDPFPVLALVDDPLITQSPYRRRMRRLKLRPKRQWQLRMRSTSCSML